MEFEPISDAVYEMLMRQGLRLEAAGTTKSHGMKKRAAAVEGADPQVAVTSRGDAAERERDGVRKGAGRAAGGGVTRPATAGGGAPADLETSLSQWRTIRVRPSLKIADGGKA